ncbi:MAG TPA: cation:proton antiporter, partial [Rariglobus sp.]
MTFESWVLLISGLLLLMGLCTAYVNRLPFTGAMVYLVIGVALGPAGANALRLDPQEQVALFLHAAEATVVISLFTVGLKLRLPVRDKRWLPAIVLAFVSMTATVGLITLAGVAWLHLPLGAAVLLGGILAPTDPVLASDLQLKHAGDRTELRLALTGEAGFNDGTAFPFVMLGLGLLGLH